VSNNLGPVQRAEAAHRTPHGKRVAAAERNDLLSTTYPLQEQDSNFSCFESAHPLSYAQSEVQRRPPDSYGRSG
ncbi:hypothetical protein, partial [Rossellomorea marisflavi]|uniref:hypothetical protein n=1 Tax=Rossellomorea marisflavi TaxID=189381 RepID=UPI001E2FB2FD